MTELDPKSIYGKDANHIMALDAKRARTRREIDAHFKALNAIAEQNLSDVTLLWMAAVQCRTLNRNREGAALYEELLRRVEQGSSLVHQTYANILDELGRHKEALDQRKVTVRLEPATWSYEGLALTLDALDQRDEAYEVRKSAATLFGLPAPAPPAPKAVSMMQSYIHSAPAIPERRSRRLFREVNAIVNRLTKKKPGQNLNLLTEPEIRAFIKRNRISRPQFMAILADGQTNRWDLPQDQRLRAGYPP